MEDLRQLVEICERPIVDVNDQTIDTLTLHQLQQLCMVHKLNYDGDLETLQRRLRKFRDDSDSRSNGELNGTSNKEDLARDENGTTNGKPPAFPRPQKPPTNLWAATQQPATNVGLRLSTFTTPSETFTPAASAITSSNAANAAAANPNRAIHRIHLSSIRHNYSIVSATAAAQQCQVIVVVKADGYGHGAILTSCELVECGCMAFAVATLEEGVALRKALDERFNPNNGTAAGLAGMVMPRIRILVLGAPVGYPACFDKYLYYDIELMVSGPEVASSLKEWMKDSDGRRRAEVSRAAERRKEELMNVLEGNPLRSMVVRQGKDESNIDPETGEVFVEPDKENAKVIQQVNDIFSSKHLERVDVPSVSPRLLQTKMNAATLSGNTGDDLAREVRQILIGQKHATSAATSVQSSNPSNKRPSIINTVFEENVPEMTATNGNLNNADKRSTSPRPAPPIVNGQTSNTASLFCGIEDAARASRQKELRVKRLSELGTPGSSRQNSMLESDVPLIRKKLRWHALVDSGMGRLGFTTRQLDELPSRAASPASGGDYVAPDDGSDVSSLSTTVRRDTVEIIQELYDAEVHEGAPIEFTGCCTHMADANDKSTYTHDQMDRFRSLIYRIRSAGIAIPTISTDNSAALLTTSLTHFDPGAILSHDTRGFVRTGGAIYGQRPAFKQLKAVSSLVATVSNVAVIHKGESVGYDRAYVATENVRIATLTVGFADGYPRELGNGVGRVSIRNATFPVAGNVCMDMLMVELCPEDDKGVGSQVTVGDTAVLWGPERVEHGHVVGEGLVSLAGLAATLKTTQSALTCGLDKIRVQRQLVE